MIPPLDTALGALPPGRFQVTLDELRASQFVTGSQYRQELFAEWEVATQVLRETVPVCVAWVGGSFVTDRDEPNDVDTVYILDNYDVEGLSEDDATVIHTYSESHKFREEFGMRVEPAVLKWVPIDGAVPLEEGFEYRELRGFWDESWSKMRPRGPHEMVPGTRLGALPRRGYLEVILDGYAPTGRCLA